MALASFFSCSQTSVGTAGFFLRMSTLTSLAPYGDVPQKIQTPPWLSIQMEINAWVKVGNAFNIRSEGDSSMNDKVI